MQSLTVYGRMVVRAVLAEVAGETSSLAWRRETCTRANRSLRLVTASAGLSKIHSVSEGVASRAVAAAPTASSPSSRTVTLPTLEDRTFGDDAFFVARHRLGDVLGVADGVGGWRTYGVDPSIFATSLMAICERMVREGRFNPARPVDLLTTGLAEVQMNKASILGSCTACVVALHGDENTLYTCNLGDSGFLVVRNGKVVHRSEEQQHYFNTPYQLAVAPPALQGHVLSDRPESAQKTTFRVEEGDIILLGTDGLFDNLSDQQILRHLELLKDYSEETIQRVAISIVNEAHHLGFDPKYNSPFSKNAANNGFDFLGGKPDDVTVILARVTDSTNGSSCDIPQVETVDTNSSTSPSM